METMSMPGFTADQSVYLAANYYMRTTVRIAEGEVVHPQLVLPPWTPCCGYSFVALNSEISRAAKGGACNASKNDCKFLMSERARSSFTIDGRLINR